MSLVGIVLVSGSAAFFSLLTYPVTHSYLATPSLKKKNHAIAYHFVREGVAREEWVMGYVKSGKKSADTLTKTIPAGERRDRLVGHYLYEM